VIHATIPGEFLFESGNLVNAFAFRIEAITKNNLVGEYFQDFLLFFFSDDLIAGHGKLL
jgi:hypothetical protein